MDFKEFFSNHWMGINNINLDSFPLEIPEKTIKGKVRTIFYTENPISVVIDTDNGTPIIWKLTKKQWDYITKIKKQPKKGKNIEFSIRNNGIIKIDSIKYF